MPPKIGNAMARATSAPLPVEASTGTKAIRVVTVVSDHAKPATSDHFAPFENHPPGT